MRSVKEWAGAWIFIAFAGSAVISLPTGGVWSVNMRPRTHRAFAIYNTPLGHRSNAFGRPKSSSQIEANISFGACCTSSAMLSRGPRARRVPRGHFIGRDPCPDSGLLRHDNVLCHV